VSPQVGTFRWTGLGRRPRSKMLSTEIDPLLEKNCHLCRRSKWLRRLRRRARADFSRRVPARAQQAGEADPRADWRNPRPASLPATVANRDRDQNERSRARPQPRAAPPGASSLGSAAAQLVTRARPATTKAPQRPSYDSSANTRRPHRRDGAGPQPDETLHAATPELFTRKARCRFFEPTHRTAIGPSFLAASSTPPRVSADRAAARTSWACSGTYLGAPQKQHANRARCDSRCVESGELGGPQITRRDRGRTGCRPWRG
jgi:hypothetical protein